MNYRYDEPAEGALLVTITVEEYRDLIKTGVEQAHRIGDLEGQIKDLTGCKPVDTTNLAGE